MKNLARIKKLSWFGKLGRSFMNRFMYSQLSVLNGIGIAIGIVKPLIKFKVETDPPSVYWVYRILPSEVEGLAQKLGLPPHFSISPIKCLDTDEPEYLLIINCYRVSGLVNGLRAEWSVFVNDENNIPRYMIVDVRSSTTSVDPIRIVTKPSKVIHERTGDTIITQIGDEDEAFLSKITLPSDAPLAVSSLEFVSANDYIYWRNGIRDRSFYNAGLANARQRRIETVNCEINDGSDWAQFVEPDPIHVLIFEDPIEFVISPWENVDKVATR